VPSRKLQSSSEGHYPRRSSKLRHTSDVSTEDIFGIPHSHPFIARPREPSRISEGDEAAAEEVDTEQQTTLPLHEKGTTTETLVIEQKPEDGIISQMQTEIEALREELEKKYNEVKELQELKRENAFLKSKIESLEAAFTKQAVPVTGDLP
jgi:predicted RNase H-like nuclease (RuvC/YqgF family)